MPAVATGLIPILRIPC